MYNHEPENYKCPFCGVRDGVESDFPYSKQADIFYQDDFIIRIIASHWWPTNRGHVIIIPKKHQENIFDIDEDLLQKIHVFSKKVAIALKELYHCDGVTIRQNNESPGDQDVWHYHLHVFPRFVGDNINQIDGLRQKSDPKDRIKFAEKLRKYFSFKV